jgi:transmembrane sensor
VNAAELIDQQASRWLSRRDARVPSAQDEADFHRWLNADIRHRVAYLRLEGTWKRSDRLHDLRPLDRGLDPDLLRAHPLRSRWPVALAASLALACMVGGFFFAQARFGWQHYETRVGGFSRIVLEDGSVIDLNTDSDVRVRLRAERRDVKLLRGEGRFQVAHDPRRPFVVTAADASVRAVGTAFSVRLREASQVDVLVAEGSVAVVSSTVPHAPPVTAGEAAVLQPNHMSVRHVEPEVVQSRLAWTSGRLQFRGETLGDAVAEFNRYNRRQIRLADASLARLRVGGTFNATDPESFAAALSSAFRLQVAANDPDTLTLRPP